jgi:hypothetical protein
VSPRFTRTKSRLQLPCVIEGGDGHIVVPTAHVRIRAKWSQKAGCAWKVERASSW